MPFDQEHENTSLQPAPVAAEGGSSAALAPIAPEIRELLTELRQAGKEAAPELIERGVALGSAAIPSLIEMATDESLHHAGEDTTEVWAPLHAIKILGELRAAEAVEPLLPLLEEDDDWLDELLPEVFGKLGLPALEPLRAVVADRTRDVFTRSRAAHGLVKLVEYHPEERADVVETLSARLDPSETQSPDDEMMNGLVISSLLDLKATEVVPAIRQAFEEDRVDPFILDWDFVAKELDLPRLERKPDSNERRMLHLYLKCRACGYTRLHQVAKVYCDLNTLDKERRGEKTKYSEFVIPQRISCPKCGAVDQYDLTNLATLALTGELIASATGKDVLGREVDRDESPLEMIRFGLSDGTPMHPLEALEMYRSEVERQPDRSDLRVKFANVLEMLGYQNEAIGQHRKALELDPTNLEACANLGQFYRDAGRLDEARWMLERVLDLQGQSQLPIERRLEFAAFARESLAEMAAGITDGQVRLGPRHLEQARRPAVRASATRTPQPVSGKSKVGRNDLCPCGSGKKYKKCHGR